MEQLSLDSLDLKAAFEVLDGEGGDIDEPESRYRVDLMDHHGRPGHVFDVEAPDASQAVLIAQQWAVGDLPDFGPYKVAAVYVL